MTGHRHWFTSLWSHFGEYGPRDVHIHDCIEGEPGTCWRVIIGQGADCGGKDTPHERMTLTEGCGSAHWLTLYPTAEGDPT